MNMYKGNLLDVISPQKQEKVRQWYRISFFCCAVISISLSIAAVHKLLAIAALQKRINIITKRLAATNNPSNHIKVVQDNIAMIDQKKAILNKIIDHPANPYIYMQEIAKKIPEGMCLTGLSIGAKKNIELRGQSIGHSNIVFFTEVLNQGKCFRDIRITELHSITKPSESHNALFSFTLTGKLNKVLS